MKFESVSQLIIFNGEAETSNYNTRDFVPSIQSFVMGSYRNLQEDLDCSLF